MASSTDLLGIAVERGYLTPEQADQAIAEAAARRCSPEQVLLERRAITVRRLERLRAHQQFRVMRKNDKSYLKLAVRQRWIDGRSAKRVLDQQRRAFESRRLCLRAGALLIEQSLLSNDQDRSLRTALSARQRPIASTTTRGGSSGPVAWSTRADSAATLALHESSVTGSDLGASAGPTYRALEAALERVEAIRAIGHDLSTSDPALQEKPPRMDSAEELENACAVLGRRRVGLEPEAPRRRPKKSTTSTGKFLAALLKNRGAA